MATDELKDKSYAGLIRHIASLHEVIDSLITENRRYAAAIDSLWGEMPARHIFTMSDETGEGHRRNGVPDVVCPKCGKLVHGYVVRAGVKYHRHTHLFEEPEIVITQDGSA